MASEAANLGVSAYETRSGESNQRLDTYCAEVPKPLSLPAAVNRNAQTCPEGRDC